MTKRDFGPLIRTIVADVNDYIDREVTIFGIRQGQVEYFLLISQMPGINQLEISGFMQVGKTAVTKALKILEKEGYIERIPDPEDKRFLKCFMSAKGKVLTEGLTDFRERLEGQIFQGISEDEVNQLMYLLGKVKVNAESLRKV